MERSKTMIKYDYLQEQANDFVKAVKLATQKAKTNEDMECISDIVSGMIIKIPDTIIVADTIDRYTVCHYADEELDKKTLDQVMQFIADNCLCSADDDQVVYDIDEAIKNVNVFNKE